MVILHRGARRHLADLVDVAVYCFGAPRQDALVAAAYEPWEALAKDGKSAGWWSRFLMAIIYFFISPEGVIALFSEPLGKLIVLTIITLNITGFLWIRKIENVDI